MKTKISRATVASMSGIRPAQFDYLRELDIVRPDIGDQRKGYSPLEARLAVIAGRAIACGMSPQAISEPMKWLREQVAWPVELPEDNLAEAVIQFEAERYRMLEGQQGLYREILARWIYGLSSGDGYFEITQNGHDDRKRLLDEAKRSDALEIQKQVQLAEDRAKELLKAPSQWSYDRFREIERALEFELACQRKRDQFFHISVSADSWKTRLSWNVEQVETESAWLVISIRRLFTDRIFSV